MKNQKNERQVLPKHSPMYGLIVGVVRAALRLLTGVRFVCDAGVQRLKKSHESFIVLCQHPSMLDAAVLYAIMAPRRIHTVAGRFQYIGKKSQRIFEMMGVIPKRQFYTDIVCVRSMLAVLRQNGVLAFMPEGRISMDGTMSPIEDSTGAFIKKCGVPVAVVRLTGSYFVMGSWRRQPVHLGPVRAKASVLFEKEDLAQMDADTIQEKLQEALYYNQFEQSADKRPQYMGKARGISTILYRCHACGAIGTFSDDGKTVRCGACGFAMRVGRDRFFAPVKKGQSVPFAHLAAYNDWQKNCEKAFWQAQNARLAYPAVCRMRDDSGAYTATQEGILCLDTEKMTFRTRMGELLFEREMSQISGVSADYTKRQFTMYEKNGAREFTLPEVYCIAQLVNSIVVLHENTKKKESEDVRQ